MVPQQVGGGPVGLLGEEGDALFDPSPFHEEDVDDAGRGFEELIGHGADDDPGEKMRQIENGLRDLFKPGEAQLVEHQGQDDGHRE